MTSEVARTVGASVADRLVVAAGAAMLLTPRRPRHHCLLADPLSLAVDAT